ncbi:monovalent cation/H+ antiporter subunit D family protein [Spiribacter vilamensis]|uniref:Multisubunit sodium/proton antiporter MrpD subunit n=1 Tax=Spiribacter vilamensis TaxID=531306 RepID=A0A4Q8CY87_9GAMM|nr:monovalent cation/H+ antiporter subunit D family protein [Spiribacter vilamensis]RZU97946.1 multisubunit sodium/proton antiporter MrpD subunit [Spiribacter vilamensis]TVO61141.1 monovalent cation/H+ antiporter subunit D family protein [Spiribacter vilamensis]
MSSITELMPFVVLIPLIAGPVCVLLPGRGLPWLLATFAMTTAFIIAALVLAAVFDGGTLRYAFGDWPPPVGIEYRVDAANAFVALLITGVSAILLPWGKPLVDDEVPERQGSFYALVLIALAGLLGITLTGDVFNVFVFLEISSLATYGLIAHGRDRRALIAAFRYLIMGTVGATFLLIGIAVLYILTGSLNMLDIAERLPVGEGSRALDVGLGFIVVGLSIKLALFPLHHWLPNAYTYAPSLISALIAATATKVALYVLLRFIFDVFGPAYSFTALPLAAGLMALAIGSMFVGSWLAILQSNLKRMLAYSSVAQVGYMVLGVSLTTVSGLTASFLHLFNHGLMKAALFASAGLMVYRCGGMGMNDLRGIGRQMPWTLTAFALAGVSLVGLPPTAGFISKWYLLTAAVDAGQLWLVALVLITSLMALFYIARVVEIAWMQPRPDDAPAVEEVHWTLLLPVWVLVAANFWFGIDTRLTVGGATRAAEALSSGALP